MLLLHQPAQYVAWNAGYGHNVLVSL